MITSRSGSSCVVVPGCAKQENDVSPQRSESISEIGMFATCVNDESAGVSRSESNSQISKKSWVGSLAPDVVNFIIAMTHEDGGRIGWRRRTIDIGRSKGLETEAGQAAAWFGEPLDWASRVAKQHVLAVHHVNRRITGFVGRHVIPVRPHREFRIIGEVVPCRRSSGSKSRRSDRWSGKQTRTNRCLNCRIRRGTSDSPR